MTPNTSNPTRADGTVGLGIVKAVAAGDILRNTASPTNLQELWLTSRFRLTTDRARLVAELAFNIARRRA